MHIVTVFSALPRTGKTTLAFELACRLARNGNQGSSEGLFVRLR